MTETLTNVIKDRNELISRVSVHSNSCSIPGVIAYHRQKCKAFHNTCICYHFAVLNVSKYGMYF